MCPLSSGTYFRHNKRKLLSSTVIIVAAICLVYVLECFIACIVQSVYPLDSNRFAYGSVIAATESDPNIPQDMVDAIDESENFERAVAVSIQKINFSVPGSSTHAAVLGFEDGDMEYIIEKFGLELERGRLPAIGTDEIAVDRNVALNNDLQIGSLVGCAVDKSQSLSGQYTVVGILTSDSHISIMGAPLPSDTGLYYEEKGYLAFHRDGSFEAAQDEVTALGSQGVNVWTLNRYDMLYAKNQQTFRILDMMVILAIIVMVVCLVCSKYAQYFTRRSEIGILNALGYTRRDITVRLFWEVILTNSIGLVAGLLLALLLCRAVLAPAFDAIGGAGVYLSAKAAGLALLAPLSTTLFTLIPVHRLIGRVDAISIVERT